VRPFVDQYLPAADIACTNCTYRRDVGAAPAHGEADWSARLPPATTPEFAETTNRPLGLCVHSTTPTDQSISLGLSQEQLSRSGLPSRRNSQGGFRAWPAVRIYQLPKKPASMDCASWRRETTAIYPE